MKKAIVALAIAAYASTAMAVIENSAHDLHAGFVGHLPRASAPLSSCQFCHAPHNANLTANFTFVPLWNRTTPTGAGGSFLVKNTATNQAPSLGGASLTCLSCHDGAADIGLTFSSGNAFQNPPYAIPAAGINNPGTNVGATYDGSSYTMGANSDLRDDHPVGIDLPNNATYYRTTSEVTTAGLHLYGGGARVECGSCHDPHETTYGQFLRIDPDAGVGLCGTCHKK